MTVIETVLGYLPHHRKQTPSGWFKFNGVCCENNGHTKDRRGRAGVIQNADGVSYHCFNCGFKASYQIGRHLTRKMRQLLSWLGADDSTISKLAFEALKIQETQEVEKKFFFPTFPDKTLPRDCVHVSDAPQDIQDYVAQRGFTGIDTATFLWSPEYQDRLIIPFLYEDRIVGWTGRKVNDGKPKYLSDQTPNYVFNTQAQQQDWIYTIVVEGPLDALSIDGVALLGAEISDGQAAVISRLMTTPVLVADRDKDGLRTIEQAIEKNWNVSFPPWPDDCKDANDAMRKFGKLATVRSILAHRESNPVKIKLQSKSWNKG